MMPDREKVINDLQDAVNDDWMWRHADYYALTMERAIALLKEQPEIVRCKDCIHRPLLKKFDDKQVVFTLPVFPDDVCPYKAKCSFDLTYPKDDWFCANGKMRNDYD